MKHLPALPALLGIVTNAPASEMRLVACTALQLYDDPGIGEALADAWPGLSPEVQKSTLNLLASRKTWSIRLLEAVASGRVPRAAFSADLLARLRRHADARLTAQVDRQFPAVSPAVGAGVGSRVEQVRQIIGREPGNPYAGEPLYAARCAGCHTLFYKGGKIGPDLTSYQRDDLGTLLISVLDPNAAIREGFENYLVTTRDDRTLSGFLADQDASVVVLRGFDGADLRLLRSEIVSVEPAGRSLMPEGVLDGLSDVEIRDLFAYLRQSQPITK